MFLERNKDRQKKLYFKRKVLYTEVLNPAEEELNLSIISDDLTTIVDQTD